MIICPACAALHLVNRKIGKVLGQDLPTVPDMTSPHTATPTNIDQRPSAKEETAAAFQRAAAAILRPLPNVPLPKKRPTPRRGCRTDGGHFCFTGARSINSQAPQVLHGQAARSVAVSTHQTAAFFHFGGSRERVTQFPKSILDNRRCRDGSSAKSSHSDELIARPFREEMRTPSPPLSFGPREACGFSACWKAADNEAQKVRCAPPLGFCHCVKKAAPPIIMRIPVSTTASAVKR